MVIVIIRLGVVLHAALEQNIRKWFILARRITCLILSHIILDQNFECSCLMASLILSVYDLRKEKPKQRFMILQSQTIT